MVFPDKIQKLNARFYAKRLFYDPKWIVLGVNNICNLHCKMCDVGTQNLDTTFAQNLVGSKPLNMPIDTCMRIIDQTAQYYPDTKLSYGFTEPLVYPYLITSLVYAEEKGLFTSVTTNALSLPQKAEALVASGLNEINVSLDGPEEIHNEIRGNKKSFARAIEGIQKVRKLSSSIHITVICAITEWNQSYLLEFANQLNGYGINQLALMHTQFTTQEIADQHNDSWGQFYPATDSNLDYMKLENMDPKLISKQLKAIKASDYDFDVYISPDFVEADDIEVYYHHPEIFVGKKCNAVMENLMIKSNGNIIPSHGRCYNITIGNILESELNAVWNNSIISKLRTDLRKSGGLLPACTRCCSGFG